MPRLTCRDCPAQGATAIAGKNNRTTCKNRERADSREGIFDQRGSVIEAITQFEITASRANDLLCNLGIATATAEFERF
ncbi:Uncharacterised protein [Mycobacterium tuberculosis]|nr:Uncharacterised protein [Mycobacterium tuberculosis]